MKHPLIVFSRREELTQLITSSPKESLSAIMVSNGNLLVPILNGENIRFCEMKLASLAELLHYLKITPNEFVELRLRVRICAEAGRFFLVETTLQYAYPRSKSIQ